MRRVECVRCGVMTERVPWAEPTSPFTRVFDELVEYLAQCTDQLAVSPTMGVAWRTVGKIAQRFVVRLGPQAVLDNLTDIGTDELSVRKHHEYITVVTDHVAGRIVWAAPGKNADTAKSFLDVLGPERTAELKVVTMDMSGAYIQAVTAMAPQARLVFDRFHLQRLAHNALDEVRRTQLRELKGTPEGKELKLNRFALQKNPWNLNHIETETLAVVQRRNRPLYRAYLLKRSSERILPPRSTMQLRDLQHRAARGAGRNDRRRVPWVARW